MNIKYFFIGVAKMSIWTSAYNTDSRDYTAAAAATTTAYAYATSAEAAMAEEYDYGER